MPLVEAESFFRKLKHVKVYKKRSERNFRKVNFRNSAFYTPEKRLQCVQVKACMVFLSGHLAKY